MPLLVFGSVNADVTVRVRDFPSPGVTVAGGDIVTATGGKSANQAVASALAGAPTAFVGRLGDDAGGVAARAALQAAGVDVRALRTSDRPTGTALIAVREDGENTIIVAPGANADLSVDDCPAAMLQAADWVLLGLEVPVRAVEAMARRARAAGVKVALNVSPVPEKPVSLDDVDLLIVNEHEAQAMTKDGAGLGVDTAVITRGAEGAVIVQASGERITVPPVRVEVADTTGCGDAFAGVLVGRLAAGDDIVTAAGRASRFAAAAATGIGAQSSYPRDFTF